MNTSAGTGERPPEIDLKKLCDEYIAYIEGVRNFAPPTVRSYRYILGKFAAHLDGDIRELTLEELDNYIVYFSTEHDLKPSSQNTMRCVLRSFFMYLDRYRNIRLKFDYSLIRQTKAPRARIEPLSSGQVYEMISRFKTSEDKLIVATMFSTGMRIGELVRFAVEDFHATDITVRGKGSKDRVIPIDDTLSRALRNYLVVNNIRTGPVFRRQKGNNLMPYTVSGLRKRFARQLGPLYKKPHALRHGIATELLRSGMDIRTLQTFLGHSDIRTTMLYTHVTDQHLSESYLKHFDKIGFSTRLAIDESA